MKISSIYHKILSFCIVLFFTHSLYAQQHSEVIVGADFDYPPYSFIDINGKAVGHDVDVMDELSKNAGFTVSYKLDQWDSTLNALENGLVDVVACIVYSEEREKVYDFTIPLHTEYYAIFSRKPLDISDVSDLQGKKAIVLDGDIANDKFLKPMGLFNNYYTVKSLPEAIMWLEYGKGDYVVAPYPLGMQVIKEYKCSNVEVKGPPVFPSVYCLAVQKGNKKLLAQLNNGIEELRKNGKLNQIHSKWVRYKRNEDRYKSFFQYALWILGLIVFLFVIFIVWWWLLKKQVAKQKQAIIEAESVYENVFNSVMDALIILSPDGIIVDANPMALKMYNTTFDDFIGKQGKEFIDTENDHLFEAFFKETAKGKVFAKSTIKKKENNQSSYFNLKGSLLQYRGQEHHMVIIRDVTEETNSQLKIQKAIEETKSASRTKSAFLSTMSHEIRTPLNAIIGFSKLLAKTDLSEKQNDYNSKIEVSSQLLLELVSDVLDVTKIEAGKMELESAPFKLKDLFRKIMDVQRSRAEEKGLGFELTISENVPKILVGDSLRLSQVILNLVSNAVKFTEKGSVLILVRKGKEYDKNNIPYERIWVTVKDTGIGIEKEKIDELFVPFTQSDSSNTRKFGGTGLGLSISRHLVSLMGGELYVESKIGKGSIFSFFVALPKANEKEFKIVNKATEIESNATMLSGLRLLLVEDNEFNAQIYKEQLSSYGAEVKCAYNSEEAFDHLVIKAFDIILMDIELPGMDGFETTKKIKQYSRWNHIPIIALSAYDSIEEKEKALSIGMVEYLSKPVLINELVSTIINYTNKPQKQNEKRIYFSGIKHFDGNERLFNRALARFASVYYNTPNELSDLLNKEKYKDIKTIVHNLKSGAAMIGAKELDTLVRTIDVQMKEKVPLSEIKVTELVTLLNQTLIDLKTYINE